MALMPHGRRQADGTLGEAWTVIYHKVGRGEYDTLQRAWDAPFHHRGRESRLFAHTTADGWLIHTESSRTPWELVDYDTLCAAWRADYLDAAGRNHPGPVATPERAEQLWRHCVAWTRFGTHDIEAMGLWWAAVLFPHVDLAVIDQAGAASAVRTPSEVPRGDEIASRRADVCGRLSGSALSQLDAAPIEADAVKLAAALDADPALAARAWSLKDRSFCLGYPRSEPWPGETSLNVAYQLLLADRAPWPTLDTPSPGRWSRSTPDELESEQERRTSIRAFLAEVAVQL